MISARRAFSPSAPSADQIDLKYQTVHYRYNYIYLANKEKKLIEELKTIYYFTYPLISVHTD
jgi:hypothetical protein